MRIAAIAAALCGWRALRHDRHCAFFAAHSPRFIPKPLSCYSSRSPLPIDPVSFFLATILFSYHHRHHLVTLTILTCIYLFLSSGKPSALSRQGQLCSDSACVCLIFLNFDQPVAFTLVADLFTSDDISQ